MNENNLVKVENENGESINLLILEEFDYKNKRYALLQELDKDCNCDGDCDCKSNDKCDCEDCNCKSNDKCDCEDCNCDEGLYILEITKDEKGNEIFKSIDDDKLFDEVSEEAEKIFNEE